MRMGISASVEDGEDKPQLESDTDEDGGPQGMAARVHLCALEVPWRNCCKPSPTTTPSSSPLQLRVDVACLAEGSDSNLVLNQTLQCLHTLPHDIHHVSVLLVSRMASLHSVVEFLFPDLQR
eukprot:566148-Rhodomonas_salina.1